MIDDLRHVIRSPLLLETHFVVLASSMLKLCFRKCSITKWTVIQRSTNRACNII